MGAWVSVGRGLLRGTEVVGRFVFVSYSIHLKELGKKEGGRSQKERGRGRKREKEKKKLEKRGRASLEMTNGHLAGA